MVHWEDRQYWLEGDVKDNIKEIWDGDRFRQLYWVWDLGSEWLLPARSPICSSVVSTDIIEDNMQNESSQDGRNLESTVQLQIECCHCFNTFQHQPVWTRGDPRNIALIGHWDGWLPFGRSSSHSSGK